MELSKCRTRARAKKDERDQVCGKDKASGGRVGWVEMWRGAERKLLEK